MNRDLISNISEAESIRPQVAAGTVNGQNVDLLGADSAAIIASIGAITGAAGDASISLQESDTAGSGYTTVAAGDILGSLPTALTADTTYKFGYIGAKQHVRAVFSLGGETNVAVCVVVVKGDLARKPDDASYSR